MWNNIQLYARLTSDRTKWTAGDQHVHPRVRYNLGDSDGEELPDEIVEAPGLTIRVHEEWKISYRMKQPEAEELNVLRPSI